MEKFINIPLTKEGAEATCKICAGFRGEHKATALIFTPDSELSSLIEAAEGEGFEVVCRTDFALISGEYFRGEEKSVDKISEPFYLTAPMTLSGLDGVAVVSLLKKSEGEVVNEFFKAQVKLCFEESGLPYKGYVPEKEQDPAEKTREKLEEIISEATTLMEGKIAAVKSFADRSATQLSRVNEIAGGLESKVAEVVEKLEKGEFDGKDGKDGKDADLSLVANALVGSAVGVELEISDLSPLPHEVELTLEKNLVAGVGFTDVEGTGYCCSNKTFLLKKGTSYRVKATTKSGTPFKGVVIESFGWTAQSSPAYAYDSAEIFDFEAGYNTKKYAIYLFAPASEVGSVEIFALTEEDPLNKTVTVKMGGKTQVYLTDERGKVSLTSEGTSLTASAGELFGVRAAYKRDIGKAIPEVDGEFSPESDNPQSGKAVAKAVSGKADVENWELIETITLTDAVNAISKTAEPDGTPYCFAKMFIRTTVPKQTANESLRFHVNQYYAGGIKNGISASWDAYSTFEIMPYKSNGGCRISRALLSQNTNSFSNVVSLDNCTVEIGMPYTWLKILVNSGEIPIGTQIEIWGVRA